MNINQMKRQIVDAICENLRSGTLNGETKENLSLEDYEKFCKAEEAVAERISKMYK